MEPLLPDFQLESAIARNSASFEEWIETYYFRQREFNDDAATRQRYRDLAEGVFKSFEGENGPIASSFYCEKLVAAAILTEKRKRLGRWRNEVRLHLLHNILQTPVDDRESLDLAKLLYQCTELAIKVNDLVRGRDRRITMGWIYGLVSDLLARLDEKTPAPPFPQRKVASTKPPAAGGDRKPQLLSLWRGELKRIQGFYERSATRGARVGYLWGMIVGFVALGIAGWPSGWALSEYVEGIELHPLFGSFIAGAIGAIVSVMWRMTRGNLTLPVEAGADHVRRLGAFRPVLGAIFGLFLFFVIDSGILVVEVPDDPSVQLSFFVVFGFLAGFSERFVKDVLGKAEGSVTG